MLKMIECGTTTSSCAVLSWVMNTELCVQLCDPIDCSHPGSFVHGIFQERILERVAISSSRRSSQPKDPIHVSCVSLISRWVLYHCTTWKAPCSISKGLGFLKERVDIKTERNRELTFSPRLTLKEWVMRARQNGKEYCLWGRILNIF